MYNISDAFRKFREAHQNADTDNEPSSIHHTLGKGPNQAARGNHNHDGTYSPVGHNHDGTYVKPADITNLTEPPRFRLKRVDATSADNQSITNAVLTALEFTTTEKNVGFTLNNVSGKITEATATVAGVYDLKASMDWASAATGRRFANIERWPSGGSAWEILVREEQTMAGTAGYATHALSIDAYLAVGDKIRFSGYQSYTGPLNVRCDFVPSKFQGRWVAPS